MTILAWLILVALLLLGAFAAVNWTVLTTPMTLSLVFMTLEGPLGVLLLAVTLGLMVLFALYAMALRATLLSTVHRLTVDAQTQRELAERAEASRYNALREYAEREFARLRGEMRESIERAAARAPGTQGSADERASDSARHEYVRKMQLVLDEWDDELARLEARAADLKEDAREEWHRQIAELKAKTAQGRERLQAIGREAGSAWEDVKGGLESAWDSIGRALVSARERFRQNDTAR